MFLPTKYRDNTSKDKNETITQQFLDQIDLLVKQFEKTEDPAVKQAVEQLQGIRTDLEVKKNHAKPNWGDIGKRLLYAANWLKILYDVLRE